MIRYSLLDTPSVSPDVQVENVTARIDEGLFAGTIITYDPIKLDETGTRISYGLVVHALVVNDEMVETVNGNHLSDNLKGAQLNTLMQHVDDIFNDVLKLLKNNIQFGA